MRSTSDSKNKLDPSDFIIKMNEVLPQKLIVESDAQCLAFCETESLVHLKTIVFNLKNWSWHGHIVERIDRAKSEQLQLECIVLHFSVWYNGFIPIIEAIGRLRCRLNLFLSFGLLPAVDIDYGNIAGLYWYIDRSLQTEMTPWFSKQLSKTRIIRAGIWWGDSGVDHFKDNYAVACNILAEPDSLMHSMDTYYPDYAFMLREHSQRINAFQNARVRFAVCCKRKGIPRDIMRLIAANLSPKDWEDTIGTSKSPKWVKDTLKKYRTMQDKNKKAAFWFGCADRAITTEEYEDAKKCQFTCEKEVQEHAQELREIQKRWTTNKFGVRVIGPRKKIKTK